MKKLSLLLILFLSAALTNSQDQKTEVFAPFVSRLKAKVQDSSIMLTWRPSRDVIGDRLIYRYTEEISESNFKWAQEIARAASDSNSYIDSPPDQRKYYYAVLLEDSDGKLYKLFIPYRNITILGKAISILPPEEELAAQVSGIKTEVMDDSILISFRVSKPNRELLLFMSTSPMRTAEDLLKAPSPLLLDANTTRYQDYPIPDQDWYYAIIDAGLFKIGKSELFGGVNTTLTPVRLPMGIGRVGFPDTSKLRPLPLPYLLITSGVELGDELSPFSPFMLPERVSMLQSSTSEALTRILSDVPSPSIPQMKAQVLTVDRALRAGGEAYTLQTILNGKFLKGKFKESEDLLLKFLSIRRSDEIENRARFYLAQAYYFQGRYRQAFMEFLLAEDRYYQIIQPWLDACFRCLWKAGETS